MDHSHPIWSAHHSIVPWSVVEGRYEYANLGNSWVGGEGGKGYEPLHELNMQVPNVITNIGRGSACRYQAYAGASRPRAVLCGSSCTGPGFRWNIKSGGVVSKANYSSTSSPTSATPTATHTPCTTLGVRRFEVQTPRNIQGHRRYLRLDPTPQTDRSRSKRKSKMAPPYNDLKYYTAGTPVRLAFSPT